MTNHTLLRAHGRVRRPDGDLDRHVDRGRDHARPSSWCAAPARRTPCCTASRPTRRRSRTSTSRYLDAAGRDRPVPRRLLRPRARLPRARSPPSALGAKIIEKHFTTDRTLEGNDHKVSLLPGEFKEMVAAHPRGRGGARHRRPARGLHRRDDEPRQPRQVAWSPPAASRSATPSTADAVDIKSPGRGLQPNALDRLVGPHRRRAPSSPATSSTPATSATPRRSGRAVRLQAPVGPAGPLPRHRRDDARLHCPTSSSSTSPTRTSRSTPPTVFAKYDGRLPTRRSPATPPTCSPATSCSTSPARTTPTGSARSRELQRVIDADPRRSRRYFRRRRAATRS